MHWSIITMLMKAISGEGKQTMSPAGQRKFEIFIEIQVL